MSAATATLIAGGLAILGTLLGTIVGLFGERWVRNWGEVRCVIGGVRYEPTWVRHDDLATRAATEDRDELPESGSNDWGTLRVVWTLELRFFNEKDEPTGLHAVSVAFVDGEGKTAMIGPLEGAAPGRTRQLRLREERELPDLINLPSQQWVSLRVEGSINGALAVTSMRWERIEARAEYPNGEPYVREIDNRSSRSSSAEPA